MADTTARALRVLELLQSAQQRTVAELSERLGVDERTIRRDAARLVDLGLPVESVRGRHGGYRLAPGHRVLPLMFTAEEAVAVYLGLVRAQATAQQREIAAQTALSKIRRALPTVDAGRVDDLLRVTSGGSARGDADPDPAVLLTLAEAVTRRRVLDLRYVDRRGASSRRTVHAYDLVTHSERWYVVALDTAQREERTFRVDRIRSARLLRDTFTAPRRPDAEGRLLDRFAEAHYRWHVVLRIRSTEDRIRAHLPRTVARLDRLVDGEGEGESGAGEDGASWYRAEIRAESLDWLPSVIAALECEVRVDAPLELRDRVRAAAERMLRAAGGGAPGGGAPGVS
ncbi:helix-turn-helix transcriptional regulator [Microbacterium sp. XT11]|uniref:helix-turn-helix transcriptional regulator n=1 Tax=Microbacterium sp. XT11 TaxID=367477 RepID=UPI00082CA266|nr:WYL domain-containing protein [Microbacterium sp. XT11]